jgi:hypothetical protein
MRINKQAILDVSLEILAGFVFGLIFVGGMILLSTWAGY